MRIKVENQRSPGGFDFGDLLGLFMDEHETLQAVVRISGYGLYLHVLHPSKVTLTTPEEEAAFQP